LLILEDDSNWKNLATANRNRISSTKCHTVHRFGCFDIKDSYKTDTYNAVIATTKAHNFYYADDCIKKIFNAGEFLKLSFGLLAVLIFNLF
jgi:hypothetical protein